MERVRGRKFKNFIKISHIGPKRAVLSQKSAKMGTFGVFCHFWGIVGKMAFYGFLRRSEAYILNGSQAYTTPLGHH